MLSQIGYVALPPEVAEKVHHGHDLGEEERAMVARLPAIADHLLEGIPRLNAIRSMLTRYAKRRPAAAAQDPVALGGEVLRLAIDLDVLETAGTPRDAATDTLCRRNGTYDPAVIEALVALTGHSRNEHVRELPIAAVRIGTRFVDDVWLKNGTLLVARGYEVTRGFVERVRNVMSGQIREPVRVVVPD